MSLPSLPPELIVQIGSFLSYEDRTSFRATCHYHCDLLECQRNQWLQSIPVRLCHYSYRLFENYLYVGWFPHGCAFDRKQEENYRRYTPRSRRHMILTKQLSLQDIPLSSPGARVILTTQGSEQYKSIGFPRCISLYFVDAINKHKIPMGHRSNVHVTTREISITVEFGVLDPCEDHLHANLHNVLHPFEIPARLIRGFDKCQLYTHYL